MRRTRQNPAPDVLGAVLGAAVILGAVVLTLFALDACAGMP